MKSKRGMWIVALAFGLSVSASQVGCGMEEPQEADRQTGSLEGQAAPGSSIRVQPGVAKPTALRLEKVTKEELPGPLYPVGLWKGVLTRQDKSQEEMTLNLSFKKLAMGLPVRRAKRPATVKSSWWQELLLGTAHACGPYVPATSIPLSASWTLGSQSSQDISGDAETYDNFKYSSSLTFKTSEGLMIHAWLFLDQRNQILLQGQIYKQVQVKQHLQYTLDASFSLSRQSSKAL